MHKQIKQQVICQRKQPLKNRSLTNKFRKNKMSLSARTHICAKVEQLYIYIYMYLLSQEEE